MTSAIDASFVKFFSPLIKDNDISNYISWLKSTPKLTTYRINTQSYNVDEIISIIQNYLAKQKETYNRSRSPKVYQLFSDIIAVEHWSDDNLKESCYDPSLQDVIVDAACGCAVLRGANVFAPAVMGLPANTRQDERVNIFADITGNCKRGLKVKYPDEERIYVGLGKLKMLRKQLFNVDNMKPKGIAVETIMPESRVPVIDHSILPKNSYLLQNLPSVVCSLVLQPKPEDIIIDLCAAPGNKTTHLAQIINDQGTIIALDKRADLIDRLKQHCSEIGCKSICAFAYDSTKAVLDKTICSKDDCSGINIHRGPPFVPESFDKVLLDAPCSALGQRPLLKLTMKEKQLKSFVSLQRKLFYSAYDLLKPGGRLVYSTCTVTPQECEGMVGWALNTFCHLQLVPAEPLLGDPGWQDCGLDDEQRLMVQRFGPQHPQSRRTDPQYKTHDTIGFFIACFTKCKNN